ncbi:hypothetical protein EJ04DRAFT_607083 [Polyplosphaeria fusca]|uniref:CCHC-type domain-containing protein n=1 Tax=Polyplosphaeria fusca TaxID=682080 RepID=A0A9P4QX64_9PLEO|nr:hypothetical protein EJ04DRAFT_607083 [Polyplosphaeria fusca]
MNHFFIACTLSNLNHFLKVVSWHSFNSLYYITMGRRRGNWGGGGFRGGRAGRAGGDGGGGGGGGGGRGGGRGGFRGGGGGGRGNQNNQGNQQHWKGNPHNGIQKRGGKNKNNQKQWQDSNQGGKNQPDQRDPCTQCGRRGHKVHECNAQKLDEDEACLCGCLYHHNSPHCVWNQDPLKREQYVEVATNKICQWCKRDSDGAHVWDECPDRIQFRNAVMKNIFHAYDGLMWCWHCASEEHKIKACPKPVAEMERALWDGKISSIMMQWKEQDMSNPSRPSEFEDEDQAMKITELKAPIPRDYPWCLYCQDFGHWATESCDRAAYYNRCPTRFKGQPAPTTNNFRPPGYQPAPPRDAPPTAQNAETITIGCNICSTLISFPLGPPGFYTRLCPNCLTSVPHPFQRKLSSNSSNTSSTAQAVHAIKTLITSMFQPHPPTPKNPITLPSPTQYLQRPSNDLVHINVFKSLPERPYYTDMGARRTSSNLPFYAPHHDWNSPGNYQTYFPAVKVRLDAEHLRIHEDVDVAINRAGRLGWRLECRACGVVANVRDDEGDLVMAGAEPGDTIGCGVGRVEWGPWGGRGRCDCYYWKEPRVEWIKD